MKCRRTSLLSTTKQICPITRTIRIVRPPTLDAPSRARAARTKLLRVAGKSLRNPATSALDWTPSIPDSLTCVQETCRLSRLKHAMISTRSTAEGNAQRSNEALRFAQVFFRKQDAERDTLSEMYHDQANLIWNGQAHKTKTAIAKYYRTQDPTETTLQALDAQIMPQMGDIIDMITVIAGGRLKQKDTTYNFSRTFLLGPNAPGSTEYLIVSDTMRTYG